MGTLCTPSLFLKRQVDLPNSKKDFFPLILCHKWDSNLQYSDPESIGRLPTPAGDTLDDLLTPCAGTLRSIVFTIYESGT